MSDRGLRLRPLADLGPLGDPTGALAMVESPGIVSNMENSHDSPSSHQAAAALRQAEISRETLAHAIVSPRSLFASLGAAVAVQIAAAAVGLGVGEVWILVAGAALLVVVAGGQLIRFAHVNGVWLGGFVSRVVLGTGAGASLAYAVALAVAIWAGYGSRWWLVAVCAVAGGAAYAFCGWRWMRDYRDHPADLGPGESTLWLVGLALAAGGGLVALLLNA